VRMWPDPDVSCGVVEHVSSGRRQHFSDRESFWEFLSGTVGAAGEATATGPPEPPALLPPLG
jgi:hypothetical protein